MLLSFLTVILLLGSWHWVACLSVSRSQFHLARPQFYGGRLLPVPRVYPASSFHPHSAAATATLPLHHQHLRPAPAPAPQPPAAISSLSLFTNTRPRTSKHSTTKLDLTSPNYTHPLHCLPAYRQNARRRENAASSSQPSTLSSPGLPHQESPFKRTFTCLLQLQTISKLFFSFRTAICDGGSVHCLSRKPRRSCTVSTIAVSCSCCCSHYHHHYHFGHHSRCVRC